MARTLILVIEDDAAIRRGLCDAVEFKGYAVEPCGRGDQGLEAALAGSPDLVLLDVLLPGRDGFSVLRELRIARPRLPVIMVTARGDEEDRVRGLEDGADDYVVKPFSATELLARVDAVLRRSAERPTDVRSLVLDDKTVDFERLEIVLGAGKTMRISALEGSILRYLAVNAGRPIGPTGLRIPASRHEHHPGKQGRGGRATPGLCRHTVRRSVNVTASG